MRLTVLYDPDGVILAAVEETGRLDHPVPQARDGNAVGSFLVPQAVAKSGLETICLTHRVERGAEELRPDRSVNGSRAAPEG